MALIKGKQIQDTSVSLTKLSGSTGSVTLTTGTITAPAANLIISTAPVAPTQAANKEYVDSVATGLDIKKSVTAIYRESTPDAGGTPAILVDNAVNGSTVDDQAFYTIITNGSPINQLILDNITITDGDRVLIAIKLPGRQKVNGIYVFSANRLERADDADNVTPNTGEVSGGMFTFVEQGDVYSDTGWVLSSPNGAISNSGTSGLWDFTNNPTGNAQIEFTQFSAAGVAEAGVGLTRTGTKFNVNYDNSSIGIDGADALYVKANGITNDMILNEFITFAGDSGSSNIALGSTLTIAGGTNGIDTTYSTGTLTINLDLSELSTVTTITDSDFIAGVTANGATNQKITFANLKTLIGAASQLNISAEGAVATSFDLDTDTLNFATGQGLTFAATGGAAPGTTNTLTLTVSNNELKTEVLTGYSMAVSPASMVIELQSGQTVEIFSVTLNGVALKKTSQWELDAGFEITIKNLPYIIEPSDEFEITYRVQ
jgi:hypothetical protein